MRSHPKVDLKAKSRRVLETCVVITLAAHVVAFMIYQQFGAGEALEENVQTLIQVDEIPPTEQIKRPPPPARPSVPIESEDEDLLDDVTIEDTDIAFDEVPPPPPPPPEEENEVIPPFLPLEDQPKIVGGIAAIQKLVKYPELARKAGVEGTVIVKALIGTTGSVDNVEVVKGLGAGCDEAAADAVRQVKFTPAKQRGKPVRFWFSIPIKFQLAG
jgi:protein TonB